jgi:hypothetical protein
MWLQGAMLLMNLQVRQLFGIAIACGAALLAELATLIAGGSAITSIVAIFVCVLQFIVFIGLTLAVAHKTS